MSGSTVILWVLSIFPLLLALVLLNYAARAFRNKHLGGGLSRLVIALLFLTVGLLAAMISLSVQGFRVLTSEQLAATVEVQKLGEQRFQTVFTFPDGVVKTFELAGDEFSVEAKIVKWHPWANFIGLQTAYELDRVSGRYTLLDDEQTQPRTVYSLGRDRAVNLFSLSQRLPALSTLIDAQYGSSTFTPANEESRYEVRVSTTGLLVREVTEIN
jgi:hypothetical protein